MREVDVFLPGYYEATSLGLEYKGFNQELLLFSDIEIFTPTEFVDAFKNIQEDEWIGAWFGEDDVHLLLEIY